MIITKEQQEAWVDAYVKEKHTQDECIGFIDGINKALSETAKRIHTQGMMPCEWISVEDRLPETIATVLVKFDNGGEGMNSVIKTGRFEGSVWLVHGGSPVVTNVVKSWMPLPDPSGKTQGYISLEDAKTQAIKFAMSVCGNSADKGHFEYLYTQFKSQQTKQP